MNKILITNFKRPIGLSPHAPVAQKIAELCTLIASLVKRLFVRADWTECTNVKFFLTLSKIEVFKIRYSRFVGYIIYRIFLNRFGIA